MCSLDLNRFIDLSERERKHLCCGICLNILNNAVNTECGHTFCKQCLQTWIECQHKECPECRQELRKRKRPKETSVSDNLIIICENVFNRNVLVNAMINELKVNCSFDFNGCQQPIELGSLSAHLKDCEYRICEKCDFTVGTDSNHNCFELLKNDRNQYKLKLEEEKTLRESMTAKNTELEQMVKQKNRLITLLKYHSNIISFDTNYVMFGTHLSDCKAIDFHKSLICFKFDTKIQYFGLKFNIFQTIMYCFDPSLPVFIIGINEKPGPKSKVQKSSVCIRNIIQLTDRSKGWFDVYSEDSSERYIIIRLSPEKIWKAIKILSLRLSKDLIESIDVNTALNYVMSARKLQIKE